MPQFINENDESIDLENSQCLVKVFNLIGIQISSLQDLCDGHHLFSLLQEINSTFFKANASKLTKGEYFSNKLSNITLCWDSLVAFIESKEALELGTGIFDNLADKKPDLAAAANGDLYALTEIACIMLLSYFSCLQDVFVDKIKDLSQEDLLNFAVLLQKIYDIDLLSSVEGPKSSIEEEHKEEKHISVELNPFQEVVQSEKFVSSAASHVIIQNLHEEIGRLERCNREQEALLRERDSKILQISKQLISLQSLAEQKPLEEAALNGRIKEQENQISLLQQEISSLKRQTLLIPDLKRQLKASQEQNNQLNEQISHIGSDMSSSFGLKSEIDSLKQQITTKSCELTEKALEIDSLNSQLQILSQEKANLLQSTRDLQQMNNALNERLSMLLGDDSKLNSPFENPSNSPTISLFTDHEIDRLKKENSQLQARIAQLLQSSEQDSDLQTISESLNSMIKEKDDEIQNLKSKFNSLKESVKREQRLIMSAWYDLGVGGQKKAFFSNSPAASSDKTPSTPTTGGGWLQLQRNKLDSMLLNSSKMQPKDK